MLGVVETAGSSPVTQTKKEIRKNLLFSFVFPQKLVKACVFAVNKMGLFLPELGLEQARFLRLTTCQTIDADHINKPAPTVLSGRFFFDYAGQILAPTGGYIDKQKSACYNKF